MFTKEYYETPKLTLTTLADKLEFLCELLVEFENMKDNGFDLLTDVQFQGWISTLTVYKAQFSFI